MTALSNPFVPPLFSCGHAEDAVYRNFRDEVSGETKITFPLSSSLLRANGEAALPALISAHLLFAASAIAFRPAALSCRLGNAASAEATLA
jgi:hypothetical protein